MWLLVCQLVHTQTIMIKQHAHFNIKLTASIALYLSIDVYKRANASARLLNLNSWFGFSLTLRIRNMNIKRILKKKMQSINFMRRRIYAPELAECNRVYLVNCVYRFYWFLFQYAVSVFFLLSLSFFLSHVV